MIRVQETCVCGAKFGAACEATDNYDIGKAVNTWRKHHLCSVRGDAHFTEDEPHHYREWNGVAESISTPAT